ncbi:binding-protein-dependent transport systems inner membrane component [Staphylothermus marinus F1]|uniref:Binding-protein-dependent transport systems inner membrane component n=1 Tax=Staphylothermus marinus (strain ATCC 43588 / DSM 3639 / JCM 9404 / F1) TaxID=399550 RepID=A3DLE6_STAMF|nr:ABC transporter permease [Staphylothermus marinus]ABN69456.1 binding-protein-dependent transport systems inner membrane component [Staphylothermus marinus F1]
MSEEVYEKKILDKIMDKIIDGYAKLMDKIRPGWYRRNKARIDEWKLMAYAFNRSPPGLIGFFLVIIFLVIAIIGPFIAPFSYDLPLSSFDKKAYLAPPGTVITIPNNSLSQFFGVKPGNYTLLLGGDDYGRDLLSRILYGARTSLVVAILVMLVGPWIGIAIGLIAGYYGGKIDEALMRLTDIFLAFPGLILAIAFSAVLPPRIQDFLNANPTIRDFFLSLFALKPQHAGAMAYLVSVIIALWIVWWPGYARLVRGLVLSARENVYVEAARALGVPTRWILLRHIFPNILGPVLVYLTLDFGGVILTEAGLSFLGVGAVPPIADWGRIINDGSQYFPNSWWLVFYPGLMILLTVLGFNLIGDTLRDVLDPKTRRSVEFKLKKKKGGKK